MDPAWFSAQVDFYQPVLKEGFRALPIELHVSESAPDILNHLLPIESDLWQAKGLMSQREESDLVEPYTGLKILFPYGKEISNTQYLVSALPNEELAVPEKTDWKVIHCIFSPDYLTDDPSNRYLCNFRKLIHPNILAV